MRGRNAMGLAARLLGLLLLVSCTSSPPPVVAPAEGDRIPVIYLPGITGSELRNGVTGETVFGSARSFFFPRDDGYSLARPLADRVEDPIEAGSAILEVRLLTYRREVYAPLLRFMKRHGYRHGDLRDPRPSDDFFFFPYDWRQSNVESARRLANDLERLRVARGDETLVVHLVAQSSASYIARWFMKYGGGSLEDAEADRARPPANIRVGKLVLLGTANGGSIRIIREIDRGRRYVSLVGRDFRPEIFFTFPSLYEDLPVYSDDLFVDGSGDSIDIDLFDPRTWQTYEWSIFSPEARARVASKPDLFGDEQEWIDHLRTNLDRAQRFHAMLALAVPWYRETEIYSLQNVWEPTPARAVLRRRVEGWETLFAGDPEVDRDPWLRSRAIAPGDAHATLESQQWLSTQERAAVVDDPVYFEGGHFEIVLNPATHRKLLAILE